MSGFTRDQLYTLIDQAIQDLESKTESIGPDETTVADYAAASGIGKTTARKRLESLVDTGFLSVRVAVFGRQRTKIYKIVKGVESPGGIK